jgi:hypothetical protein
MNEDRGAGRQAETSKALRRVAARWLERLGPEATRADRHSTLKVVSHAWNLAVVDRRVRSGVVAALRARLSQSGAPLGVLQMLDGVVAYKRAEASPDDRVVADIRLVDGPDGAERLEVDWVDLCHPDFDSVLRSMIELAESEQAERPAARGAETGKRVGTRKSSNPSKSAPSSASAHPSGNNLASFLEPVLTAAARCASSAERRKLVDFATLVWNTVVQERLYRPESVERLREEVERRDDPVLLQMFDSLVARKRGESTPDNGVLMAATVRMQAGAIRIGVDSCEAPRADDAPEFEWFERLLHDQRRAALPARRASKSRRGAPKAATRVSDPWRTLHERAAELYDVAPWRWMGDEELFGVRLPGEREVHWVCVMGAAGAIFGLAVYDGDVGFEAHRRVQADEVETPEAAYGTDGWLVTFVPRAELSKAELARAEASGVRFASAKAWPQFERTLYGKLPRAIEEHQVARVTFLIERAIEAVLARAPQPELLAPDASGARKVWTTINGDLRIESIAPGPPPRPNFAPIDREAVKRLQRSARRVAEAFEFDVQPWIARIADESGGEFVPAGAALVDARTGRALGVQLLHPEQRYAKSAAELVAMLQRGGVLPREVRVRRAWVREAVKPTLDALGVRTTFADELPMLAHFTNSMAQAIERGDLRP